MIVHQELDGRPVMIAYFHHDMSPADDTDFDIAKIMYQDNGEHVWITNTQPEPEE